MARSFCGALAGVVLALPSACTTPVRAKLPPPRSAALVPEPEPERALRPPQGMPASPASTAEAILAATEPAGDSAAAPRPSAGALEPIPAVAAAAVVGEGELPAAPTDDSEAAPPQAESVLGDTPAIGESGAAGSSAAAAPAAAPAPAELVRSYPKLPKIDREGLRPARWEDLPGWRSDSLDSTIVAFLRSCAALGGDPAWAPGCAAARALPASAESWQVRHFFETHFRPYQVLTASGEKVGRVTGYYEPLLHGSRTRSERFRFPLYAKPPDLLRIELDSAYPELENRGLRGRVEEGRVVPYFSREEIEGPNSPVRGQELVWVDDPVEALFLHIQGSGQVQLDSGDVMRVGFADQNGHPFRSVALYLKAKGELNNAQLSLRGIKDWARKNPVKAQEFLNFNPRYVFFRELPLNLPGPIGTLGVPLTAERSVAIDPSFVPLGAPVFLATRPRSGGSQQPWSRLMLAQDTGGVIRGGVRADVFWGFGEAAGRRAQSTNQNLQMWVLLPLN